VVSRRKAMIQTVVSSTWIAASPARARNLPDSTIKDPSLVPILQLQQSLRKLLQVAVVSPEMDTARIDALLRTIPRQEDVFKALFDAYSDPLSYKQRFVDQNAFLVYYTKGFDGPGRPSIEDDLPVKQTIQYGTRNDAWVAYNSFLVEIYFQRQNPS
jgi:hypothetical protein